MVEPIQMHLVSFVPAIILGLMGGILGAIFTRMNTNLNFFRKKVLAKIKNDALKKMARMLECLILAVSTDKISFKCL